MASIGKLSTGKWQARWRDPDGRQRKKTFTRKLDADRFLTSIEADKLRGLYIDPDAGKVTLKAYADQWLAGQTFDDSTRAAVEIRMRLHVYPVLGNRELRGIKPSAVQAWIRGLDALAPSYRRIIFVNTLQVFSAAVDDDLIAKNPCRAASVRMPQLERRKVVPWSPAWVLGVHDALPDRYQIVVTLASGLGLRQGEVFGLSPDDIDWLRGIVEVRRQVKLYAGNLQAYALPKGRKSRTIPLPPIVRDELAAYLKRWPPRAVTLPWASLSGESVTAKLIVTSRESKALNRGYFNSKLWKTALAKAGVPDSRQNGMHALRHYWASLALASGVNIKAISECLGHSDPGFTLRVYAHLMADSNDNLRTVMNAALTKASESPRAPAAPAASK